MQAPPEYPPEFLEEIGWYPKNLQIVDSKSKVVPFDLYDIQIAIDYEIWKAKQEGKSARILILKARREGCSSLVTARFYRDARENSHRKSLIMCYDETSTRNVLQMVRFFYDNDRAKKVTVKDSDAALKFENGSEFFIYTAGSGGRAARSFAAQAIHLSEPEFFDDPEVLNSVLNIISEDDPAFTIVIESTAKGPGGIMQNLWNAAIAGRNGFKPLFFPWHAFHKYTRALSYSDLLAHSPRAFVEAHKQMLTQYKEEEDALGQEVRRAALARKREYEKEHPGKGGGGKGKASRRSKDAEEPSQGAAPPSGGGRDADLLGERRSDPGQAGASGDGLAPDSVGQPWPVRIGSFGNHIVPRREHLEDYFDRSLSDYERAQIVEHSLTREQINWRRWIRDNNCQSSEVKCMHEFPSDPEEAFSISEEVVLDPFTLRQWIKEAEALTLTNKVGTFWVVQKKNGGLKVRFEERDGGKSTIFHAPDKDRKYVMGIDPSSGLDDGDWQIACVLEAETGEQVAEYRGKLHPDQAINQVEALGIYYNNAFTACEANAAGLSWARALEDRGTLPLFEREVPDRKEPWKKTKLIGWMTSPKTRDDLLNEVRRAVREGQCPIRSLETLRECLSLWVTRTTFGKERIEARDGCHDDGVFGYGIALQMRLRELPAEEAIDVVDEEDDGLSEVAKMLIKLSAQPQGRLPMPRMHQSHKHETVLKLIDGRRGLN